MHRLMICTLALALAGGCATIASRAEETITITSEPSGADVSVDCGSGTNTLKTPATFLLARKASDCTVTLQKTGFEKETAVLEQGVNRWTWGNVPIAATGLLFVGMSGFTNNSGKAASIGGAIALTGFGGLIVDRLTWRLRDHDPKRLHVKLRPAAQQ